MIGRALRAIGKSDRKVVAVFAIDRAAASALVDYLRTQLRLPVWLYTLEEPGRETREQCAHVTVNASGAGLWLAAQRELWPYRVALSLTEWNNKTGHWALKVAPFTIPLFRALILNEDGGYFSGTPRMVFVYNWLRARRFVDDAVARAVDITQGIALWIFAFFAQWNSAFSRAVFRRIRGTEPLSLTAVTCGSGTVVYQYREREWDAASIDALVQTSEARWIYFCREGQRKDARDLEALFSSEFTFVASRQHAVRSWRKLLFATAPFRQLQPGEVSSVYAPVSPGMLADVAKLRALGVPALKSFGSNWFLLFHRAAAAGWHSDSLGSGEPTTELAAVPFDEADFVKTLLAEPETRRLQPQATALARGNIARGLTFPRPWRGLPRVLVVSPYLPYPLSHGGAVRMWNLCRCLSDRVDFVLACFREQGDVVEYETLQQVFRQIYVVDIDEKHRNPLLPKQVNGYTSSSMRALIGTICEQLPIDLVQVEYTQMAAYREAAASTPALLVEHDLTFSLYQQLAESQKTQEATREYERWLAFERERLRAFDAVWTMSELDRSRAVAEGSPEQRTFAVPNGVDLGRFRCPPADAESQRILYVGSFRHLPNFLAFQELCSRIMPQVWMVMPDATLEVVAGPNHRDHWPGTQDVDRRVTVHGFVQNLGPLYSAAAIVVVPLPVSAGTNIKLMEALACQRAVVSTPVGCAGLALRDGQHLLIRDLGPEFGEAICALLRDPAQRDLLATSGLSQARERFSWSAIAATAYQTYEAIVPSWRTSR